MAKPLASEASSFFSLVSLYAPNVPPVNQQSIVNHPFRGLCRIKPNAYGGERPQVLVPFLEPRDIFDSEVASSEIVLVCEFLDSTCFILLEVQSVGREVMHNYSVPWSHQPGLVS